MNIPRNNIGKIATEELQAREYSQEVITEWIAYIE